MTLLSSAFLLAMFTSHSMAAPSIAAISNKIIDVSSSLDVPLSITGTGAVTVVATSSDTNTIPNSGLVVNGSANNLKITVGTPSSVGPQIFSDIDVKASDSTGNTTMTFRVVVNRAPTLTAATNFSATEDTTKTIAYTALKALTNDSDPDTADTIEFELISITNGTMNVAAGTRLGPTTGDWTWTPPLNNNGTIPAFKIRAYDGRLQSSTDVQVSAAVAAVDNDPPVLGGTIGITGGGNIPDDQNATPFAALTVSDPDHNKPSADQLTAKVNITDNYFQSQFLVTPGWTAITPTSFSFGPAAPSNVETALKALQFVPDSNKMIVGQTGTVKFSVEIVDASHPSTASATQEKTLTVESINDVPTLTVTTIAISDVGTSKPFRVTISDPDLNDTFTLTMTETTAPVLGALSPASVSTSGTLTVVQNFVKDMVSYTPNSVGGNATAQFSFTVTDSHTGTITKSANLRITGTNDAPEISGATVDLIRTTDDPEAPPVFPFSTIRISDPDAGQSVTVTLFLDDPGKGKFFVGNTEFTTKTATVTELTNTLRSVRFVPTPNRVPEGQVETATVVIFVNDTGLPPLLVFDNNTQIAVTSVNGAPVVELNGTRTFPATDKPISVSTIPAINPFDGIRLDDDGDITVKITLDNAAKGTFTNLGGFVESPLGSHRYQFTGSPTDATTAMKALVFVPSSTYQFPAGAPGRTNFTIDVADAVANRSIRVLPIVLANLARNWLVTSSLDSVVSPGSPPTVGSLRWAVEKAENNDVITFALPSYPALIRLRQVNGPLILSKHVSIKGPGADQLTITGDSNSNGQTDPNDTQLFKVYASVSIDSLTLTRGYATNGGGIEVAPNPAGLAGQTPGSLKLLNCTIADCKATDWGGGVDVSEGSLVVENSLFRGNSVSDSAGLGGGAVSLYTSQASSFTNCTFAANIQAATAGFGGGAIYVENFDPATLFDTSIVHCTFAQNVDASNQGTSICSNVFNAHINISNSIFSDSTVGLTTSRNLYATGDSWILSGGRNISTDRTTTTFNLNGVRLLNHPTDLVETDPVLLPLGVSVGSTASFALGAGSPAINRGAAGTVAFDQRGVLRDSTPDSGAVEGPVTARILINEIFPPASGNQFIEFYVPRNSTAFNLNNYELWVDGILRHKFPTTIVQPGYGLVLMNEPGVVIGATQTPSVPILGYSTGGLVKTKVYSPGHNLADGTTVTISGSQDSAFNGTFPISLVDQDNFNINVNFTVDPGPGARGTYGSKLSLTDRSTVELRTPTAKAYESVSYVNVFVNQTNPLVNLEFTPSNSISLVPEFVGAAFIPTSLAKSAPTPGVEITYLDPPSNPVGPGPHDPTSPGKDNGNTPFGLPNSYPAAVADTYLVGEDANPNLDVLGNDGDSDGLDLLRIIDVSRTSSGPVPVGSDASTVSDLGAQVNITPAGSPLRGTSVNFDPRVAHNHLSAGARAFDTFYYTITDVGAGPIDSYASDGAVTKIVSPGHRLETGELIVIAGSLIADYNASFSITKVDVDSFTIPITFAGDPATKGSWQTSGARTPSGPSEKAVSITVLGANDAPTPTPNTVATKEDTILRIFGDTDLAGTLPVLDTDVNYPAPIQSSPVPLVADDTDPDDDDNPAVTGTFKKLRLVGVAQAFPISDYSGTVGSGPVTVTATGHGLTSPTTILISGYEGHPSYNGYHEITVLDANRFTIPVPFIDNVAGKGLWGILTNENRLTTTSAQGAQVKLEIRANRAETNIVYNPRTSAYLNGLAQGEVDNTDSFYYAVEDSHAAISFAKVTVSVTGVNDAPVPVNDPAGLADIISIPGVTDIIEALAGSDVQYTLPAQGGGGKFDVVLIINGTTMTLRNVCGTDEDTTLAIPTSLLLSNDSDVDRTNVLRVQLGRQSISREGASLVLSPDGQTLTYNPQISARLNALAREEQIMDSFTILVGDGLAVVPSIVAVVVTGVNDQPTARPDATTIPEDQLLTLGPPGVLLNDSDPDQNTSLPDNKKMLLPVVNQGTTVFGTAVNASVVKGTGQITEFGAVSGVPTQTLVTAPAHGLQTGEEIVISGSGASAYDGQFPVTRVDDDTFTILKTFNATNGAQTPADWSSIQSTLTYDPRGSVFSFLGLSHTPAFTLDGLAQGQTYTDTYSYTMMDGSMIFANNDLYRVEVNRSSIELKVLANDANHVGLGGGLKIVSVGAPNHGGSVTINENTSIIYSPETGFVGDELFIYTVEDELGNRDSALVTARVTIMQLNGNLQANKDSFTAAVGQSPLLNVLANDDLIPAGTATLSISKIAATPNHGGTVAIEGNQIRYTPQGPGAPYTETFSYEISAQGTAVATAEVTVRVVDRTNTLNLRNDAFSVPTGSLDNLLNVLANDNVLPGSGNALKITNVTAANHGTVTIAAGGGGLIYSPPALFSGTAQFSYTAGDGFGGTNTAQVTVAVGFLTTNPDFYAVLYDDPSRTTDDGTTDLNVLVNDTILQGPASTLKIVGVTPTTSALGSVTIAPAGTHLIFDPTAGQTGQQIFTYTIEDATGHQANGTFTVVVIQQGLQANADYMTVQTDSTNNQLMVLSNDVLFVPGGGTMTVVGIGTGPNAPDQGGSVVIGPNGDRIVYAPAPGFLGVETFTYAVTDGSSTTTSRVVVRSTTGDLAAGADYFTVFRGSSSNVLSVLGNDLVIPDGGQLLTITAVTLDPSNLSNPVNRGQLDISSDLRTLIYTPSPLNTTYPYTETFTYEISDGTARRDYGLLTIQVLDRIGAREIDTNDDTFTVRTTSAEVIFDVLANDNIRPAPATGWVITGVTKPTSNVCSPFLAADFVDLSGLVQKLVNHTDPVSLFLWSNFTTGVQNVLSSASASTAAKQNALVQGLNAAVGGASIHTPVRFAGVTLRQQTSDLLALNPTGEQLIVLNRLLLEDAYPAELRQSPGGGVAVSNGNSVLYTPPVGFTGKERFTYFVSDGLGGTGSGEVIVKVGDISASDDTFVILSDTVDNDLDVIANDGILRDAFPDSPLPAAADFTIATSPNIVVQPSTAGTAFVNNGKVRYTPAPGFFGLVDLTYQVSDDSGCLWSAVAHVSVIQRYSDRSSAQLTITVTGVNDPPQILGVTTGNLTDKQTIHPFPDAIIRDVDNQLNEIITVRISFPAANGTLSGPFNLVAPGVYEFTGTGAQATAAIRALVYTPVENRIDVALTEETNFTISLQDPFVTSPVINNTPKVNVTSVNDAPVISGTVANQDVFRYSTLMPFNGVTISDVDNLTAQPLTVSVVIDDITKGNLTNLGGFVGGPAGTYTITGTPDVVNATIRALVFNPTPGSRVAVGVFETVGFTINAMDGFAPVVTDAVTTVNIRDHSTKKLISLTVAGVDASQEDAQFGSSVDISANTLVVGSPLRNGAGPDSGFAYVYERHLGGFGNWGQSTRLAPSDLATDDKFGSAVAVDGDILAVSACTQNANGIIDSGSVYVFYRDPVDRNQWTQVARLTAPLGERGQYDEFGKSVALQGNTLVVGSPYSDQGASDSGGVFVFEKDQGGSNAWGYKKKLVASDASQNDYFGFAVAIDGNTIAGGAYGANSTTGVNMGAVYVFDRPTPTGTFTQSKKVSIFQEPGTSATDHFGFDVDISGNSLVIGARQYNRVSQGNTLNDAGAAFVFERTPGVLGSWALSKRLITGTPVQFDHFGFSVSISGDLIIVGAPKEYPPTLRTTVAGYVEVYRRGFGGTSNWGLIDLIQASPFDVNDQFGTVCAIDRYTAVVGAILDKANEPRASAAGAAYVYDFEYNNLPLHTLQIADQSATENVAFSFVVPAPTFTDADQIDVGTYTYSAKLADGSPIPATSWLQFTPATATFAGTPTPTNYHPLHLIVTATDLQGITVDSNVFTISVDLDPTRRFQILIEEWRKTRFASGVLANAAAQSSTWGNDANPDGDTYSNLIEMALGTDPNAVDPPGLLGIEANPPLVTLLYQLDKNFPEEFVHPEWSTDLVNWHRININVTQRSETTALKFMAATAYPPVPGVCIYMRLKIGD